MITIFSDGGARGNPGPAASAFAIFQDEKLIHSSAKYLGVATNNVAEYSAVILALEYVANNLKGERQIKFNLDSELVVKQLNGVYKVRDKILLSLVLRIKKIIEDNNLSINFVHIPRKENSFADKLVNENLDNSSRH